MKNIIRNAKNDQLRRNFIDETAAFNWLKEQGFCPSTSSFEGCPNI
jgi:N-acetylglutamate synthase-like GNAT family acetyltransferase